MSLLICLILVTIPFNSLARLVPIFSEQTERCDNGTNPSLFNDIEFIPLNDTAMMVNGTINVLRDIVSPYRSGAFFEKYERKYLK